MANQPTIVVANLDDAKLKASIDKMVNDLNDGLNKMTANTDAAVAKMQASLQSVGNIKFGSGGSDGGSTRRTKKQQEEADAVKQTANAYDQLAQSQQKSTQVKSARESYYAFVRGYKEQANGIASLIRDFENTLTKTIQNRIAEINSQIATSKDKIRALNEELNRRQFAAGNPEAQAQVQRELDKELKTVRELEGQLANVNQQFAFEKTYLASLYGEHYRISNIMREEVSVQQQQNAAVNNQVSAQEKLANKIKRQAEIIRERFKETGTGTATWGNAVIYDPNDTRNAKIKQARLSIEDQLLQKHQEQVRVTNERLALEERERQAKQQTLGVTQQIAGAEQKVTEAQEKRNSTYQPKTFQSYDDLRESIAHVLKVRTQDVNLANAETASYDRLNASLKIMQQAYNKLGANDRASEQGRALAASIQEVQRALHKIQSQASRPVRLENILGFQPKTLDDIVYKIQMLQRYREGIDFTNPKTKGEIEQVNQALEKLRQEQSKILGQNKDMLASNNALVRSFNYMKNRLAFYFTVGASTQFVKSLIDIRSQYEMNERALGILINSAERGTQIFKELSEMALVSPYTLIELSSAAKQLVAYDVAARDVVDTTRRLADMASAVGVPMERLTYALGQIKAYGYLNSRDARMFANAGIPLVKQLAEHYTELEGKMVSTAEVYDRMKKKAIDYNDVMAVVTKMTDDGGKFFNFQAKMADTLKVRLANLTLAWNNMMNEIGASKQGLLTGTIGVLKEIFLRWKDINSMINSLIFTFGAFKAIQFGVLLVSGQLATAAGWQILLGKKLQTILWGLTQSLWKIATTPLTWWALLAIAVGSAANALVEANKAIADFNKSIRDGAEDNYNSISRFAEQYKQIRDSLYTKKDGKTVPVDIDKNEAKKAWETVREEIELTSKNAETYIGQLLSISNMSERVRQGFNILDNISAVNAALKELDDNSIKIEQDYSQWWNLWMLPDGLIGNLNDLIEAEKELVDVYGSVEAAKRGGGQLYTDYEKRELANFRKDLKVTTDSILDFISLKGWSGDTEKINEVFKQITDKISIDNQLDPQKAFTLQLEVEEARSKAAKNALAQRINDEAAAYKVAQDENARTAIKARYDALREEYATFEKFNGKTRVYWTDFTKWLKEQHISETREMFKGMDAAQIQSLNFQEGKYKEWVTRMVERYAKEHKMSYDSAFSYLKNWVTNANKWSIFIPLTISTEDKKSIYETLTEADTAIDTAYKKIQRLKQRQKELNEKGGLVSDDDKVREDSERIIEEIAAATKDYNDALEKGGHSKKEDAAATKAQKQAETELQKALRDELQLIEKVRSNYKELTKAGVTHAEAISSAISGYDHSVANINAVLKKYGIGLDLSKFAGNNNPHALLSMLQKQLDALKGKAKSSEIQALEVEIQKVKLDVDKFDTTQITNALNRELGNIKDEYELALELDANPELGDMFANIFGIDTDALPQTFAEAFDKANKVAMAKLQELKVNIDSFDLMSTAIKPDENGQWMGLAYDSDAVQKLVAAQNEWRNLYRKNLESTEKMLDDYVKKFGEYSDKMAAIEAKRLAQMKELNNVYYTEEMRRSQDYITKLNAINAAAENDKGQVKWDEFKNSTLYVTMFENLEYASTKTLEAIHQKLEELKGDWKQLTPEQLKTITDKYLQIETQLSKRNPFKGLIKNAKEYAKAVGSTGKQAQERFRTAQKQYDEEKEVVANLKKQKEILESANQTKTEQYKIVIDSLALEETELETRKKELAAAQKLVEKYDLMRKIFKSQTSSVATMLNKVSANLQGLVEFRDTLNSLFGVDGSKGETVLGHNLDGVIDGLSKAGQAMSSIVSSATSGNVFGVLSGTVNLFAGIGDSISSIFGGGAAKTRKLNKEINDSIENVRKLSLAYKDLERAVETEMGSAELQARRQEMVNKEAQLRELQRQKQLESEKRSKDRDDDRIKELESSIKDLQIELKEMADEIAATLLGSKVKDAAEEFVSTWVDAWRAGEDTMAAMESKFDDMIDNLIMKSVASRVVANHLQQIWDTVDAITKESSEGGTSVTMNELTRIKSLIGDKSIREAINDDLKALYTALGIAYGSDAEKSLSALQQGIGQISEQTANALEAYANSISQQAYLRNDLLVQIRDTIMSFDMDVQLGVFSQMLLQLQNNYILMQSMAAMMDSWTIPAGNGIRVELLS